MTVVNDLPVFENDRQVLHYVRDFLLSQDEQSMRNGQCLYRGRQTMACAVGCLIRDKFYSRSLEAATVLVSDDVWGAVLDSIHVKSPNFSPSRHLLSGLQSIHDTCTPQEWKRLFRVVNDYKYSWCGDRYIGGTFRVTSARLIYWD